MTAHADDIRYAYAEDLGDTIEATIPDAVSTPLRAEPLSPGRYHLRILAFAAATDLWVRQGDEDASAAPSAPSTRFIGHTDAFALNLPVWTFIVRAGAQGTDAPKSRNMLFFHGVGAGAVVQVTKISRDKF